MEIDEKYIREKVGQQNPFRVPQGYFDQLADRVMSQLPERELRQHEGGHSKRVRRQQPSVVQLRKWIYAAACVAVVAVMGLTFHFRQPSAEHTAVASVEANTDNTYMDEAADYAMLDNSEIYACLADN